MKRFLSLTISFFIFLYVGKAQNTQLESKLQHLDNYLEKALKDWQVPGMAVGIVQGDSLIFAKGYGVRNIEKKEKVDANTLFPVASISKTFTSTAIATLVDEEKISWDDKVIDYLPWFELYDPYVTSNFKIRDLLSHRSGLKTFSGDLLWYGTTYTREEIVRRAKHLKPVYGFREKFGYSNIMFIAAGEVIKSITQKTWDEYITEKFFKPLEMGQTNTSIDKLIQLENIATPHTKKDGKTIPIEFINWDNMGPAGSINSNVTEMSRWISLHLNKGKSNNSKVFNEQRCYDMWTQHTVNPVSPRSKQIWETTHFKSYGLGWSLFDYHGYKIVGHNGGYDGILSSMQLIPEKDMGFIILTNKNAPLYYLTIYKILDVLLTENYKEQKDWSAFFMQFEGGEENTDNTEKKDASPTLPLSSYQGTYESVLYGNVEISVKSKQLFLKMIPTPKCTATLEHLHYNTFEIEFKEFPSLPKGTVHFFMDAKGIIERMEIDVPNPDFDFTELKLIKKE